MQWTLSLNKRILKVFWSVLAVTMGIDLWKNLHSPSETYRNWGDYDIWWCHLLGLCRLSSAEEEWFPTPWVQSNKSSTTPLAQRAHVNNNSGYLSYLATRGCFFFFCIGSDIVALIYYYFTRIAVALSFRKYFQVIGRFLSTCMHWNYLNIFPKLAVSDKQS